MSEDRVMVVTGASSGLGAEVSEHFALQGYRVAMNYLIEPEAQATFDRIAAKLDDADRLMKYQADVANREQVRAMFDAVVERFGRVDVLVNFAGINRDAPFVEMTDAMWDSVSAHLRGHFVCCQEYVFHNPERPGAIINLGAACGQIGRKNGANFCSAKGGVIALTKCLAQELAPRIRVNCLVPGSVRTREVIDRYDLETEEGLAKELASLPMGRLGEFEDITSGSLSHFTDDFLTGEHDFKFGVEIENTLVNTLYGFSGGKYYYDFAGEPYFLYESTGYNTFGDTDRMAGYVQDSWGINDRVRLNLGVRFNYWRGHLESDVNGVRFDQGTVFTPDLGIAPASA